MFCFLVVDDGAPYRDVCVLLLPLPDRGGVRAAAQGRGGGCGNAGAAGRRLSGPLLAKRVAERTVALLELQLERQGWLLEAPLNPMVRLEPTGEVTPDSLGNQRSANRRPLRFDRSV